MKILACSNLLMCGYLLCYAVYWFSKLAITLETVNGNFSSFFFTCEEYIKIVYLCAL